jgi:hypothetical protein
MEVPKSSLPPPGSRAYAGRMWTVVAVMALAWAAACILLAAGAARWFIYLREKTTAQAEINYARRRITYRP